MISEGLRVSTRHQVGVFKYIIGKNKEDEYGPCKVYLTEVQLNVTPCDDDDGDMVVCVDIKYKVRTWGKGYIMWVKENEIFDTREDVYKYLKLKKETI